MAVELDAIVLADDPLAQVRIAGLSARERAVRVAKKSGATRVLVIDGRDAVRANAIAWRASAPDPRPLLVILANQLVHVPLVAPLIAAMPTSGVVAAVGPAGEDAGAFIAAVDAADSALVSVLRGHDTAPEGATLIPHGDIARHAIGTPAERAAAHKLLYRILTKPQDNALTRYVYRPISFPLTRMLVWTPITPNQISLIVAVMVAIGCWMTMHAEPSWVLWGTVTILVSSYVDCCDGEVARVKLLSSKLGAWVDTIVDELSSVAFIIALGYHCHLHFRTAYLGGDYWFQIAIVAAVLCFFAMYCIYYNIIVAVGSANSQDYISTFEVVPGSTATSMRLRAAAEVVRAPRPQWLTTLGTLAMYIPRRDFLGWLTVLLAALHLTQWLFAILTVGSAIMTVVLAIDHFKLRRLRSRVMRTGVTLERVHS